MCRRIKRKTIVVGFDSIDRHLDADWRWDECVFPVETPFVRHPLYAWIPHGHVSIQKIHLETNQR